MRESKNNTSSYVKTGAIAAILIFLVVFGLILLQKWEDRKGQFPEQEFGDPAIEYNGKEYVLKENVETFLVMGIDKFDGEAVTDSYNNNKQADFLMLLVFDNDAKQYTAIHINRDTMVDVNVLGVAGNKVSTLVKQIALAHTYGNGRDVSCRNTADSVSSLLQGMKVHHYASITMDTVSIFNDLVGGVEVEVLDDLSGVDEALIKGEVVKLMGEQALTYIRAREELEDSTNATRMKRQQQYVKALHEAMLTCIAADDEFIVNASLKLADYIISDRSVTQLQALAEKMDQYEFMGIKNIDGSTEMGEEFIEFYPREDAVKSLVIQLFYEPKQ